MAKGKYKEWLEPDKLLLLEGWARDGLTDEQIAKNIGIKKTTFYDWKNKYSEFANALKKGKEVVDIEVENALLKKALGFTTKIKEPIKVKTKMQKIGKGTIEKEHIEYVDKEVYIPPDTTAQIFWLKNRRPDKWRDKWEVTQKVDIDESAREQVNNLIDEARKQFRQTDVNSDTDGNAL